MGRYVSPQRQHSVQGIEIGRPWPLGAAADQGGVNFSVVAPRAEGVELLLFEHGDSACPSRTIALGPEHRSRDHWHVRLDGVGIGCRYGYRVHGETSIGSGRFNASKVLLDPCARAIDGWNVYRRNDALGHNDNVGSCLKGIVTERDSFDFEAAPRPRHHWRRTVIYELHPGGYTAAADSPAAPALKGTLPGLIATLPRLHRLGVTTIELLPVAAFDPQDAPNGRLNYWGYSPVNWFTPHQGYVAGDDPMAARRQMRELVTACHQAGIEVLVDVVFNHTCEANRLGPWLSWRGFADRLYYFQDARGRYQDVSGCGNSIAANRPHVCMLILEAMRCWAIELGVDGFRFDLGIALSRGEALQPLDRPPLFEAIEADPQLSDLKLVSEPWDCAGLYRLEDFPSRVIGCWNGKFRDTARRFWKGDQSTTWDLGQLFSGSRDLFGDAGARPGQTVNYVTCHDGFTLADLVSYSRKHNLANGEQNRDGDNHNNSWNHGVEGPCTDPAVLALRRRDVRNLLASLLLAPGVPLLLMGDEWGRSQGGNNNAWCQGNPTGWMVWDGSVQADGLQTYLQRLLKLRQRFLDLLNPSVALPEDDESGHRIWREWHGTACHQPDWAAWSHTLAWSIHHRDQGPLLWCGMNAYHRALNFEIPAGATWSRLIDTALPNGEDLSVEPQPWGDPHKATQGASQTATLEPRSLVLLANAACRG